MEERGQELGVMEEMTTTKGQIGSGGEMGEEGDEDESASEEEEIEATLARASDVNLGDLGAKGPQWDFNDEATKRRARALVQQSKPTLLVGSPMCTWFSRLQVLGKARY